MKKRAVIYARVSGLEQKKKQTIVSQLSELPIGIEGMGWDLVCQYTDDGKSASTGKLEHRGGFAELRRDAALGKFDVVCFVHLDRVTRSDHWGEFGPIIGTFQTAGIVLWSPMDGVLDPRDPMDSMRLYFRINQAATENTTRVERFQRGKRAAALRGQHVQGALPYALRYVANKERDGKGWNIDEGKAVYVREMFKRAVAGESGDAIAKRLEEGHIPGPQVNDKNPKGGRWDQAVIRILHSPIYRGVHYWNDVIIPVPRIVDDETWYAAQAALGESKKKGIGKPVGLYLCHQLAVCSLCGATIYMHHGEGSKGSLVRQYKCLNRSHRRRAGTPQCHLPVFDQKHTDELIWAVVSDFFEQPHEVIMTTLRGKREEQDQEAQAWSSDAEKLTAQLADLAKRNKVILDLLSGGFVEEDEAKEQVTVNAARRARLQAQLKTAQNALEGTNSTVSAARQLEELVGQLKQVARKADEKQRRDLLRLLVVRGGISFDKLGATVRLVFEPGEKSTAPMVDQGFGATHAVTLRIVAA